MSASSKARPASAFDPAVAEETADRIRELNEQLIASSKNAGTVALDAYEKALTGMLDFEKKVASASQLDWVSALAETHAKFVSDITGSYTQAARDFLK